jgi:hypothetical protein
VECRNVRPCCLQIFQAPMRSRRARCCLPCLRPAEARPAKETTPRRQAVTKTRLQLPQGMRCTKVRYPPQSMLVTAMHVHTMKHAVCMCKVCRNKSKHGSCVESRLLGPRLWALA